MRTFDFSAQVGKRSHIKAGKDPGAGELGIGVCLLPSLGERRAVPRSQRVDLHARLPFQGGFPSSAAVKPLDGKTKHIGDGQADESGTSGQCWGAKDGDWGHPDDAGSEARPKFRPLRWQLPGFIFAEGCQWSSLPNRIGDCSSAHQA